MYFQKLPLFQKNTKYVHISPLEEITAKMGSAQFLSYFVIPDRLEIIHVDKHYHK